MTSYPPIRAHLGPRAPDAVVEGEYGAGGDGAAGEESVLGALDLGLPHLHHPRLVRVRQQGRGGHEGEGGELPGYSTVQCTGELLYCTVYLVYCVLEVALNCGTLTHPYCSPTPVTTAATPLVTCVRCHVSRVLQGGDPQLSPPLPLHPDGTIRYCVQQHRDELRRGPRHRECHGHGDRQLAAVHCLAGAQPAQECHSWSGQLQ